MHPILFKIGDFPIRSFGVMVMIGVLVGSWWLARALRRLGIADGQDAAGDLVTIAILTGFLGARLLYLAIHPDAFHAWYSPFALWEGGIVSFGGFFGGALGAIWWARRHKISEPRLGDAMLPALFLGQAFGRIGCFLVGDDYGREWNGPWAVRFPKLEGGLIPDSLVGVPIHPAQLYLSLMDVLFFLVGAWLFSRKRFDGQVLCVIMLMYGVGRFLLEYTRGDDDARGMYGVLSTAQWISLWTFALGAFLYARWRHRGVTAPVQPARARP